MEVSNTSIVMDGISFQTKKTEGIDNFILFDEQSLVIFNVYSLK